MAINHITVVTRLRTLGKKGDKAAVARFFKTGEGQYGEGDVFLGASVPDVRALAKGMKNIAHRELIRLLKRREHEARLCALEMMQFQYAEADTAKRFALVSLYLENTEYVNNWDLVDNSANGLLGEYLYEFHTKAKNGLRALDKDGMKLLRTLAHSESLWERRIAMVATHTFIKKGNFDPAIEIATMLLKDKQDLIHKAVGWMLREVGKVDENRLHNFLVTHAATMPRTTLRYAIEHFSEGMRSKYMHMKDEQ